MIRYATENRSARRASSAAFLALATLGLSDCGDGTSPSTTYTPRTRTYYVAAEPVAWNYAPLGQDPVFGRPVPSPWGDSLVYQKLHYVGYSDDAFTTPVPQPSWAGILGPMIRGAVGDTIKVVFLNRTGQPLSIHPHGVTYAPADEGAVYNPPRGGGDAVAPGQRYTYTWFAEPESGPAENEPSSKVWLYHSHVMAEEEIYAGLMGTIVITDPAHANADAVPDDVDRELVTLWMVFNENSETSPPEDEEMNLKHAINGYFFGNLQGFTMNSGDRVRWYLVALGTEVDLHTPHWHGEKVLLEGRTYTDVVELLPASMKVGDMVADNPGVWLLHCHVNDHMAGGMYAVFTINGGSAATRSRLGSSSEGWDAFHDLPRVNRGGHH
jgi:FtsP/CotA-like multicopper oxidase with cupredoxin domain